MYIASELIPLSVPSVEEQLAEAWVNALERSMQVKCIFDALPLTSSFKVGYVLTELRTPFTGVANRQYEHHYKVGTNAVALLLKIYLEGTHYAFRMNTLRPSYLPTLACDLQNMLNAADGQGNPFDKDKMGKILHLFFEYHSLTRAAYEDVIEHNTRKVTTKWQGFMACVKAFFTGFTSIFRK